MYKRSVEKLRERDTMNKKKSDNKQKVIIGLLGVVSVCMIAIVALLAVNMFGKSGNLAKGSDAGQAEVAKTETTAEPKEDKEDWPYYKYQGELSDTPLEESDITYVENDWVLDNVPEKQEYIDYIISVAKDTANNEGVYANPTILPQVRLVDNHDYDILVDLHTERGLMDIIYKDPQTNMIAVGGYSWIDKDYHLPELNQYGQYIINAGILYYNLTERQKFSKEEAIQAEKKILQALTKGFEKSGENVSDVPFFYVQSVGVEFESEDVGKTYCVSCRWNTDNYHYEIECFGNDCLGWEWDGDTVQYSMDGKEDKVLY